MPSTMKEFLKRALDENTNEMSNDKKVQGYRSGAYSLSSAFNDFSQGYMRAMGLLVQNKQAMKPEYKKLRDSIATAYERLDDAISKHNEKLNKDAQEKM